MNKSIKNVVLVIVVAFLMFISLIAINWSSNSPVHREGFDISIKNTTTQDITGLKITTYGNIVEDVNLPKIGRGSTYKFNLKLPDTFNESDISLFYIDDLGTRRTEKLVDYIQPTDYGDVLVQVYSVDKNGGLSMNIKKD